MKTAHLDWRNLPSWPEGHDIYLRSPHALLGGELAQLGNSRTPPVAVPDHVKGKLGVYVKLQAIPRGNDLTGWRSSNIYEEEIKHGNLVIAKDTGGNDAALWLANPTSYFLDPFESDPESMAAAMLAILDESEANMAFIDWLGMDQPWTESTDPPAFANRPGGIEKWRSFQLSTLMALRLMWPHPATHPMILNGPGAKHNPWLTDQIIQGIYWESWGFMHGSIADHYRWLGDHLRRSPNAMHLIDGSDQNAVHVSDGWKVIE